MIVSSLGFGASAIASVYGETESVHRCILRAYLAANPRFLNDIHSVIHPFLHLPVHSSIHSFISATKNRFEPSATS